MKISNSKKELAKIISENGGWRDGAEFAAQDRDGKVFYYSSKPSIGKCCEAWGLMRCLIACEYRGKALPNWHQTTLSSEEYSHLYPAPDADGWIEWNGGECPVELGTIVDVKYRDGHIQLQCRAKDRRDSELYATTYWGSSGGSADIIAYRLHKLEQPTVETRLADAVDIVKAAAPALMSDEMKFTGDEVMGEIKPTLDQLLQDWRNADDYAKRKQAEADDAAAMRDERWKAVQAKAGEIGVTIGACDSVASEPELDITDWRDLRFGDVIEYVDGRNKNRVGMVGRVDRVDRYNADTDRPIRMVSDNGQVGWPTKWRFIRRPSK